MILKKNVKDTKGLDGEYNIIKKTVFIMSSLHNWDDSRIYYREVLSLLKEYKIVLCGVGNFNLKEIGDIKIYGLPQQKKLYKRFFIWIRLLKLALTTHASVYHFHDPELILVSIIIKIVKKNSKIIYDVHENISTTIEEKIWILETPFDNIRKDKENLKYVRKLKRK